MFYRAAEGQPTKRHIQGCNGKIEVLGAGQQAVVHGLHPEGAALTWDCGRGPDTVKRDDLPAISEAEIENFLGQCVPLLAAGSTLTTSSCPYPEGNLLDPAFAASSTTIPKLAPIQGKNDLAAGIESPNWFSELSSSEKSAVIKASLNQIDNRTCDPREVWLRALFAARDAERLGCVDARELALEWSKRGASWTSEADFDTAWGSCNPRAGGVSIGSLLAMGRDAGLDLLPWRDAALARLGVSRLGTSPAASSLAPAGRALPIAQLPSMPAKRKWLHGTDLIRGAVSMLVAPGGRGKSSWLATMALACASNRSLLGAHVFGGPLRVLMINAEDPVAEIALRIRAAMQHHGLQDADVPGLHVIGADNWGMQLLALGKNGPMLNQPGWDQLAAELDRHEPDVLIIDPLISVMGGASQNDNAAAALFMGQMVRLAATRRMGVVVAHHAAKGRDPLSAESAMGAASFVNLSRIALGIEPLADKDAGRLGLPPWEAHSVFRVVSTKANLSPPNETDRWFRLVSIDMLNAEPPIYLNGDKVGVVEVFKPGVGGPQYPPRMLHDVLRAITSTTTPLTPSKRSKARYAGPVIAQAMAPHRGGRCSDAEAESVLDHLIRSGLIRVDRVKLPRAGGRADERDGLVLTTAGERALQPQGNATPTQAPPQPPHHPATCSRHDAGGAPLEPPQHKGGVGGNAGGENAGTLAPPIPAAASAAKPAEAGPAPVTGSPLPSPAVASVAPKRRATKALRPPASDGGTDARAAASPKVNVEPSRKPDPLDSLEILDFLHRRKKEPTR
jgi:hypothetical protein